MAGLNFGRAVWLGLGVAGVCLAVAYTAGYSTDRPLQDVDIISLGVGEVIGALAAISTGTIALQVMAQTACAKPSQDLREFNHRQNMGLLALLSITASCVLATFACLDKEAAFPGGLAYCITVVTLAGVNTCIAADAADRLIRADVVNANIQLAVQRKVLGHYRRKRLPADFGATRIEGIATVLRQMAFLAVLSGTADLVLAGPVGDRSWVSFWVLFFTLTPAVSGAVAIAARFWFGVDRSSRWFALFLTSGFILVVLLSIWNAQTPNPVLHSLTLVGLPLVTGLVAMVTRANRTEWLLPRWFPGTCIRTPTARFVNKAERQAQQNVVTLRVRFGCGTALGAPENNN
jgi:hypothetical protein